MHIEDFTKDGVCRPRRG